MKNDVKFYDYLVLVFLALFYLLPAAMAVLYALAEKWYFGTDLFPSQLGLGWIAKMISDSYVQRAFLNSYILAPLTAIATVLLCIPPAYYLASRRDRLAMLTETIVNLTIAFPAIVIGTGTLVLYTFLGLRGNLWALIPAHMFFAVPFSLRSITASFMQVPKDLEEVARVFGATRLQVILKVYLPLTWRSMLSAFIFSMAISLNEFVMTLLLGAPSIKTLTIVVYELIRGYAISPPRAAAVSLFILLPSLLAGYLSEKYLRVAISLAGGGR
uniref:ABC transporter permease subunit n=1 Tax=Thermofilum pendens TaxID=2269 RepID=A0A7C4FCC5_THEPE